MRNHLSRRVASRAVAFLKQAGREPARLSMSTRTRVARLREPLFLETDPRVRAVIEAQLRSFDRTR